LSGERTILVYRGVSDDFTNRDFKWNKLKTKWIYLTSIGGNLAVLRKIFKFAKQNNIKIAWNPGSKELKLPKKNLLPLIKQTEVFLVNREEAAMLSAGSSKTIIHLIREINKISPNYWAISDGAGGAYAGDKEKISFARPLKVKVVNTTGAGDAFGSAFCASLIKKKNLDDALKIAVLNATGVITQMGGKNGLLIKMPTKSSIKKIKIEAIK